MGIAAPLLNGRLVCRGLDRAALCLVMFACSLALTLLCKCYSPEFCEDYQVQVFNSYIKNFNETVSNSRKLASPGSGFFAHPCYAHMGAWFDNFKTFAVDGVSMQDAVDSWWDAPTHEPASTHTYFPCLYHTNLTAWGIRQCNPSCYVVPTAYGPQRP